MEKSEERNFVCKYCNKNFPSGKSLGGHIRIHSNEYSVGYNGNNKKKLVDQREMMASKQKRKQLTCRECGKEFDSLKALCVHIASHSDGDSQSDTEISSAPIKKRSKGVMKQQSNSESFSNGSSSFDSEIDQECKNGAFNLMMMSRGSSFKKGHNFVVNSVAESSDNNSAIVETKSSSGEELKIFIVKNQVLETDKVTVDDQLRSAADDNGDSSDSDSDYFMNGPKKSESDISVDGSLRNNGFNNSLKRFRDTSEGGSKYELSSRRRVLPSYESGSHSLDTDSYAGTNSKIRRSNDRKSAMVKKESGGKKKSKAHECPFCFKLFKSGQALGGHKRSHTIANQEHSQVSEMRNQIDLNVPASDIDE